MMKWQELIIDSYARVLEILENVLKGLSKEDLNMQPNPDANSIGWLVWHLTRVQDDHIADLIGEEQLWIKEEWHAKFNRAPEQKDIGFGHSSKEVSAFKSPDTDILLGYYRAVLKRSRQYILKLSEADLDRRLDEPWFQPLPTVGVRLVSVISDCLQHAGQACYVRGLLKGKGWLGY